MKLVSLLLTGSVVLTSLPVVSAQISVTQRAKLLVMDGKRPAANDVEVTLGVDSFLIKPVKRSGKARSLPFSSIKSMEYSYSDRPRYTAATAGALAIGLAGLPLFFNKTKKNWLVVDAGSDSVMLQLLDSNYRMLLLEVQRKGIAISDVGDRDSKKDERDKKGTSLENKQP